MLIPVGLLVWLALWAIGKIQKKWIRIVCYVLLLFLAAFVRAYMEDNGFKICYKWHCS